MELPVNFQELYYQITNPIDYSYEPTGAKRAAEMILHAKKNNHHITIDADYDPDGFYCGRIVCDILDFLHHTNYSVVKAIAKRHGIDGATSLSIANNDSKLLIVLDSSSDKLAELYELSKTINVLVIDHHYPQGKIPPNTDSFVFINSHKFIDSEYKSMSAGLATLLTFKPLMLALSHQLYEESATLAYASVITDAVPMDSHKLISFMEITRSKPSVHPLLSIFFTQYHEKLSREFISFEVSPKLNACFRSNTIEPVYDLFFRKNYREYINKYSTATIQKIYSSNLTLREQLISAVQPESLDKFICVDLTPAAKALHMNPYSVKPYTGLVANEYSNKTHKPCICYIRCTKTVKGSVRDFYGRSLIGLFSNFIDAGGHPPAFGFEDNPESFNTLRKYLPKISDKMPDIERDDLKIVVSPNSIEDKYKFKEAINLYSLFNELGTSVPNIYLDITIPRKSKIQKLKRVCITQIHDVTVKSFSGTLFPNIRYTFKPINGQLTR